MIILLFLQFCIYLYHLLLTLFVLSLLYCIKGMRPLRDITIFVLLKIEEWRNSHKKIFWWWMNEIYRFFPICHINIIMVESVVKVIWILWFEFLRKVIRMILLKIYFPINHVHYYLYSCRASFFSCARFYRIELSTLPCP